METDNEEFDFLAELKELKVRQDYLIAKVDKIILCLDRINEDSEQYRKENIA